MAAGGAMIPLSPTPLIGHAIGVNGDQDGDGLPHVPHFLPCEHGLTVRAQARCGHQRRDATLELRQILTGEDRQHPLQSGRLRAIDLEDARVGVDAPDDAEVEHPGEPLIIEVPPTPDDQAGVLFPLEGGADQPRRRL